MVIKSRNTAGILVDIEEFSFPTIGETLNNEYSTETTKYDFQPIDGDDVVDKVEHQDKIKIERGYARDTSFKIDPRVIFHRGLKEQEEEEVKMQIKMQVRERVKKIEKKAYIKGSDEGKKMAFEESQNYLHEEVNKQIEHFEEMINDAVSKKENLLKNQIQEIYQLMKILTKWIILRELKEDGEYIKRLLEKLILELGSRENLLIKVNEEKFEEMPVILELLQKRIGELKNVRIERDLENKNPGLVIESMNTILDGSFDSQMENLDKLFKFVEAEEDNPNA